MTPMKMSNLTGPPLVITDYRSINLFGVNMFWCSKNNSKNGVLSECKTGARICGGTFAQCKKYVQKMFATHTLQEIASRIAQMPTPDDLYSYRLDVVKMHQRWRKIAGFKLACSLNKESWAGDMFVDVFPEPKNAREKMLLKKIKQSQERKLK